MQRGDDIGFGLLFEPVWWRRVNGCLVGGGGCCNGGVQLYCW